MLEAKEMAALAAKALDGKMAKDITVLDVKNITVLAEYFVICTANSTTQVKTLGDELGKIMAEQGETPLRTEGLRSGGWILVDFGCLVVHIFLEEQRKFYDLERLWSDAARLDVKELIASAPQVNIE